MFIYDKVYQCEKNEKTYLFSELCEAKLIELKQIHFILILRVFYYFFYEIMMI